MNTIRITFLGFAALALLATSALLASARGADAPSTVGCPKWGYIAWVRCVGAGDITWLVLDYETYYTGYVYKFSWDITLSGWEPRPKDLARVQAMEAMMATVRIYPRAMR